MKMKCPVDGCERVFEGNAQDKRTIKLSSRSHKLALYINFLKMQQHINIDHPATPWSYGVRLSNYSRVIFEHLLKVDPTVLGIEAWSDNDSDSSSDSDAASVDNRRARGRRNNSDSEDDDSEGGDEYETETDSDEFGLVDDSDDSEFH